MDLSSIDHNVEKNVSHATKSHIRRGSKITMYQVAIVYCFMSGSIAMCYRNIISELHIQHVSVNLNPPF